MQLTKKIHIHFSFVKKTHDLIEFFGYSYSESDIGQTLEYVKEDDACTCLQFCTPVWVSDAENSVPSHKNIEKVHSQVLISLAHVSK